MFRIRNITPLAAPWWGPPSWGRRQRPAPTFEVEVAEAGVDLGAGAGNPVIAASGADFTSLSFTHTYGDFTILVFGGGSTNAANKSSLLSSTTDVSNNSATVHTLTITITQTNYSLPTGPNLNVESGMGGTVNSGVLGPLGIFQAYADATNAAFGTGFTNGPQNDTMLGSTFDTGSANGLFTRGAGDYSITSVATLTLSGGGVINYSNHVNATAVPVPAGVVLALSSMPFLGIGAWLRRRKVQVQNS